MELYLRLFSGNSTRIELRGLGAFSAVDTITWVNDAVVNVTMVDADAVELSGESWPVALAYEAGSNGNYSALIASTLGVSPGDIVAAKVTATSSGETGYWEIPVEVLTRTHRYGPG